jgi:hypothetical protein
MNKALLVYGRMVAILALATILACGQGSNSRASTDGAARSVAGVKAYDSTLPAGKVIDTILCRNNTAHAYALYLPANYTTKRSWPCVILFDAHARGALPIRMYKDIAERYGFILIGSNTSRNGTATDVLNNIVTVLWDDIHARFNIDTACTYSSGFSGGSKVAALAAINHGGITGVIGCAGGFPNLGQGFRHDFEYFGIAGDYDFNEMEMLQLDTYLTQFKYPHQVLTWKGIHAWPPATEYKAAILWTMVNSMKKHKLQPNDTVINELKNYFDERIATAKKDELTTAILLEGAARTFEGLIDVGNYKRQFSAMTDKWQGTPPYKKYLQEEYNLEQEMATQYTVWDEATLVKKITALQQHAKQAANIQQHNSIKRVLAYTGFISYMNVSQALAAGDLPRAERYINAFKLVDPANPDCSYFEAVVAARRANAKATVAALSEAAALGYSDVDQLATEPSFTPLVQETAFLNILQQVRDNHDGKHLH